MSNCAWSVLGLKPGSDGAAVKRAYRRLAMHWHPDRNADPVATERFKEIRAAYDRLLDAEPVDYDEDAPAEDAPAGSAHSVPRAADIRLNLELDLVAAALGCQQTIAYVRGQDCDTCAGTGKAGMVRTRFCGACHGSGRIRDAARHLVQCPDCGGRGFFSEQICPDCGGSGRDAYEASLEIKVPPGMLAGDELRLAGQGEMATADLAAGDLYLTIVIRSHPLFRLSGRDLLASMPVSALLLMAGGEIRLPQLGGFLDYKLEAGLPERRQIRVTGKGFPGRGRNPAGDLLIELLPVFPRQLNARQRKLLLQANAALADSLAESLPEIDAWQQTHFPS
jgi:molecular chaperone DnaJ